jgi:hypothetical protein
MAAPNIAGVTTITGATAVQAVGTSPTAILSNGSSSGKVYKVNVLLIANVDGTVPADITVDLYRSSTAYYLIKDSPVPIGSALDVLSTGSLYLEEGDSIRLTASAANDLEAICSYEEIS